MFKNTSDETEKNLVNFHKLIIICEGLDTKDDPLDDQFQVSSLHKIYNLARQKITNFNNSKARLNIAISERLNAFKDLDVLCDRIIDQLFIYADNGDIINRVRIYGEQIKKHTIETDDNNNSCLYQKSYNFLIAHFGNLIIALEQCPEYAPYYYDLKIKLLKVKFQNMVKRNLHHTQMMDEYSNSILERDNFFYDKTEGIIEIVNNIKQHIKNKYGANSSQFNQISSLHFTNPRIKTS